MLIVIENMLNKGLVLLNKLFIILLYNLTLWLRDKTKWLLIDTRGTYERKIIKNYQR